MDAVLMPGLPAMPGNGVLGSAFPTNGAGDRTVVDFLVALTDALAPRAASAAGSTSTAGAAATTTPGDRAAAVSAPSSDAALQALVRRLLDPHRTTAPAPAPSEALALPGAAPAASPAPVPVEEVGLSVAAPAVSPAPVPVEEVGLSGAVPAASPAPDPLEEVGLSGAVPAASPALPPSAELVSFGAASVASSFDGEREVSVQGPGPADRSAAAAAHGVALIGRMAGERSSRASTKPGPTSDDDRVVAGADPSLVTRRPAMFQFARVPSERGLTRAPQAVEAASLLGARSPAARPAATVIADDGTATWEPRDGTAPATTDATTRPDMATRAAMPTVAPAVTTGAPPAPGTSAAPVPSLNMAGTERVERIRQHVATRPVQRLTVELDDARVAVSVRGDKVSVDVVSDPGRALGDGWAKGAERTLERAIDAAVPTPRAERVAEPAAAIPGHGRDILPDVGAGTTREASPGRGNESGRGGHDGSQGRHGDGGQADGRPGQRGGRPARNWFPLEEDA